jgi:predicted O-linked N-acetylglucosamine transferase (SPINDLY family)
VLPWQEGAAYYALMQRADILLDTIGFSGFNTAMQAMESGLPIVTRQGRFMRGRLASGILRSIGLEELIAMDEDHCVDLAVALVSDKNRRDAIRRRIEQRRDGLFNDVQAAHACQEHLLKLASK